MRTKNRIKRHSRGVVEERSTLKEAATKYKKLIKSKAKAYHRSLKNRIRVLKLKNTKEYWEIINRYAHSDRSRDTLSIQEFTEHFRKLSIRQVKDPDTYDDFDPRVIDHSLNEELNMDLTKEEVCRIIGNLKNNKACGIDLIRNEFLKMCSSEMFFFITDMLLS